MFFKSLDLTTALRPLLLPDEILLFVQDAVGLYEGYVAHGELLMRGADLEAKGNTKSRIIKMAMPISHPTECAILRLRTRDSTRWLLI